MGLEEALADIVRANVDEHTGDGFRSYQRDAEHGCETGVVSGLIYYSETTEFYDANEDEILGSLDEYGYDYANESHDLVSLRNARVWFVADCLIPSICEELADEADEADARDANAEVDRLEARDAGDADDDGGSQ